MSNRKDYFDDLLDDFKKRAEKQELYRELYKDYEPDSESEYEYFRKDWLSKYCAKIMASGIFHKGGLKGANLDPDDRYFEVHPIEDLENFVLEVASNLEAFSYDKDIQGRESWIREEFKSLEKIFNRLLPSVRLYKGGRAAQKLERKRKELVSLQEDIFQRPSKTPKLPDIKKNIATIFREFVKAPKVIIAERVANLLNFFGIDAKMESIRKKLKNK